MVVLADLLYVLIGLLAGGLIVLLLDSYYLGKRVQAANRAKNEIRQTMRDLERKAAAAEETRARLAGELAMSQDQLVLARAETLELERDLENSRVEHNTSHDNLARVSSYGEELQEDRERLQRQLAAFEAKNEMLQEQLDRLNEVFGRQRDQQEQISQELREREQEVVRLQRDLELALRQAGQADRLRQANQEYADQLGIARSRIQALEAQLQAEAGAGSAPAVARLESARSKTAERERGPAKAQRPGREVVKQVTVPESEDLASEEAPQAEVNVPVTNVETVEKDGSEQAAVSQAEATDLKDLQTIRGIGPVYARKLREGGIGEIHHLAALTEEEVVEIIGLSKGQASKAAGWIEQARNLVSAPNDEASQHAVEDPLTSIDPSRSEQ